MASDGDEIGRLERECETLRGLLSEAEDGRTAAPHYDGMAVDPVDASIEATRAKLARIEALLAARRGQA